MKTCSRLVDFVQIINAEGDVRVCSWSGDNMIGNILTNDFRDIFHGIHAKNLRMKIAEEDFSNCKAENCPYMANGQLDEIMMEMDKIPDYPSELHLAYEGVCNYNCTCCTSHQHMVDTRCHDYSHNYEVIEEKLQKILPHVRTLGANGRGELFASKSILKMLSSWKPIAPADEICVVLETNGSLFDEKHWKQIENLGQCHLTVAITVMSFDERIYQHLSGTKLPITRIEENLRFVKGLREQGIINEWELATVLQEENFREMPEFARRSIEEFGADKVRIRPIVAGGIYDKNIAWFMDVRNPKHPYYEQYRDVMSHPVFKHPKVLLWSGELPSSLGEHPGIRAEQIKSKAEWILYKSDFLIETLFKLAEQNNANEVYLYGIGLLGKLLVKLNQNRLPIKVIYDKYAAQTMWEGIPVHRPKCVVRDGLMIVTTYGNYEEIEQELIKNGFTGKIVSLYDLMK